MNLAAWQAFADEHASEIAPILAAKKLPPAKSFTAARIQNAYRKLSEHFDAQGRWSITVEGWPEPRDFMPKGTSILVSNNLIDMAYVRDENGRAHAHHYSIDEGSDWREPGSEFQRFINAPTRDQYKALKAFRDRILEIARHGGILSEMDHQEREYRVARPRDVRTDFTIRTCPACFRDIKATTGVMADHGYNIAHGFRQGSCTGVGKRPFEVSPQGTVDELAGLLLWRREIVQAVGHTQAEVTRVQAEYAAQRSLDTRDRLRKAQAHLRSLERILEQMDGTGFQSIRWFQAVIDLWQPGNPGEPAVGAPRLHRDVIQRYPGASK